MTAEPSPRSDDLGVFLGECGESTLLQWLAFGVA
jgi:hypothetical protein